MDLGRVFSAMGAGTVLEAQKVRPLGLLPSPMGEG